MLKLLLPLLRYLDTILLLYRSFNFVLPGVKRFGIAVNKQRFDDAGDRFRNCIC
jgi:hypothetical protein